MVIPIATVAAPPQADDGPPIAASPPTEQVSAARQAKLEAEFARLMSGATLEGSYNNTGPDMDPTKLSHDKYTLGEVRKIGGDRWLIQARIQYAEHDVTLPIPVPIRWAGDTPVMVVDNLGLPPFGTVSARVMFFGGHYAGYWEHGTRGGHLFGVIHAADEQKEIPGDTEK